MKKTNKNSMKGTIWTAAYESSNERTLAEAYGKYSSAKYLADLKCREKMINEDGEDYRIIAHNSFCFTCAWRVSEGLRVETAGASYLVKC